MILNISHVVTFPGNDLSSCNYIIGITRGKRIYACKTESVNLERKIMCIRVSKTVALLQLSVRLLCILFAV